MKNLTKQLFADALSLMARNKPIDKIAVSELCEYCGASRQTFYYHFKDKYDLVSWMYRSNADRILGLSYKNETFIDDVRSIYRHFAFHKQFYMRAIKIEGQNSFIRALYEHTCEYYINGIVDRHGKEVLTDELIFSIEFNSFGAVNMCKKWMDDNMTLPADKMADKIIDNIPDNLRKYLF